MSINSRTEKKVATAASFQQEEEEEEEEEEEGEKILKHLEKHLHVTNCIHISNHLHMQKKKRNSSCSSPTTTTMLDSGRKAASSSSPHELPLIRELTAVKKKVKALRDPPATAYSSPNIYETEVDFTENRAGRGGQRGDGVLQPQLLAGRRIATQRNRLRHDDGSGVCSAKSTPTATTNRTWVDDPDYDDDNGGEAEEMGTRRRRRTRGFVGDQEDDHHHHHQSPQWRRHQQLQYKGGGEEGCRNSSRLGRRRGMRASRCAEGGSSLEDDTDKNVVAAAAAAMRFKCRQNGHLSSSPHASSQPRGDASSSTAAAAAKSPLMCTTTSTTTEEPPPTQYKRSRTTTRRGLADASSRKLKEDDVNPKRLGIHSRGRIGNPRAAVHHTTTRGQTESPEAAATAPHPPPHDALELSEMIPQQQQQGCGIPWYQSRVHKGKKGKRLLDFAGMGFTCAFPEAMMKKKVMDSKKQQQQASRNNGLGGSLRYHEVVAAAAPSMSPAAVAAAVTPVTTTTVVGEGAKQQSTLSQLDSGANEARILVNREEEQTLVYEEQEEEQEEGKHAHECTYDDDDDDGDDDDDDDHIGTPGMDSRIEKSPSACDLLSDSGLMCSSGRTKAHNNIRHRDDGDGMGYSKASPSEEQYDDSLSGETLMHQSLSHKYRPKSFKDLVGQTLVVKALTTAITKGKIAPLYLFAGPHGTGKTSTARIFAAAVICHNTEPHRRPCGLCRECTTLTLNNISSSSSHYVKEIDASNLELDHMRSVLHRMSLLSQSNSHHHHHHRVFIVECCEALSAEAWNTFLKFLDDPPRNMVFILITSDLEHLPLAATSRCQKFSFGRLKEMEIVTRLQFLATKDALEVDEAALSLIAARANGSLHDAETTLDQLSLLDRKVSLAMVEELVGLVSDKKLLELLDFSLSANTTNTVRCLRELLDSGVDALSLVAQLASLITNILAGTSDVHSEMKGFSKRNFSKKEQQQRLRQALKVLAESEKQLRVSNDRPTWLTAALLQFAPDRSYLPSSVDTSMTPSPIAFDTFEKITAAEAYTPRIQTSGDWILDTQKSQSLHQVVLTPKLPPTAIVEEKKERAAQQQLLCATTTTSHSEGKKKLPSGGKQSEAKVHPAESPMEKAGKSPLVATTSQLGSIVLFDGGRVAESRNFQVLGCQELEDVWVKVLHGCRSNVLRQLLQVHGTLISLCIAKDNSYAVSHVEFQHVEQKARAERLRSSTCHAFQMALGCPVELKLSLSCPPTTVTEDSKTLHAMESTADSEAAAGPSNTTVHIFTENSCSLSARQMQEALLGDQQQRQLAKKNQQHHGGLVGHTCVMNPDYVDQSQIGRHQGHGCSPALENNPSEEVPQDVLEVLSRQKFRQKASHKSSTATTQPNGHLEKSDESCTQTKSKQEKAAKHKSPEFKGIISIEQETLKLQSRIKSSRRPLCWKSSPPRKLKGKPNHRRSQRRVAFFLRMVPCTRSRIK